jgi:bifunctional DNA-binding transcriptional regulator/antitoxin component of YhaV-PrlF toxin-antitoxin module
LYCIQTSSTDNETMGEHGCLVVPLELREHVGLVEGSQLLMLATPGGVVLLTREQTKARWTERRTAQRRGR